MLRFVYTLAVAYPGRLLGVLKEGRKEERDGVDSCHAWPSSYDHKPSHPYNAGIKRVGFFTDQADIACTKHEERGEVLSESGEG